MTLAVCKYVWKAVINVIKLLTQCENETTFPWKNLKKKKNIFEHDFNTGETTQYSQPGQQDETTQYSKQFTLSQISINILNPQICYTSI